MEGRIAPSPFDTTATVWNGDIMLGPRNAGVPAGDGHSTGHGLQVRVVDLECPSLISWLDHFGGNPVNLGSRQLKPVRYVSPAVCWFLFVASAFANNPIPTVVGPPVPQAVVPGSGAFTLKVYGANFVSGAVVNWNRSPRSTTFISARELRAQILASDLAAATAGYITVTNPPPGGGVSSSGFGLVEVHTPTATIVAKKPHAYFKGNGAFVLDLTDFNNDGILDFAAEHGREILAMLGNGDGTFRFSSIATYGYFSTAAIASGDFNNDGNDDLVFGANRNEPTRLGVSLGDGTGKFTKGARFGRFDTYVLGIAVGDFNRDGNLDLVSVTSPDILSVFLGQGDGSFKHRADYSELGGYEVVPADFNGDGILDLVMVRGTGDGGLHIRLGKGDGTFSTSRLVDPNAHIGCSFGPALFVSDFNGDGKADLAYCERDYSANKGKIWIALGNGDGTFKKPISLTLQAYSGVFSFAVGDFNSDGNTDLIANYFVSGQFNQTETDLFLGNGDGTFRHKMIVTLPGAPDYNAELGLVPADLDSDGLLDFIFQEPGVVSVFVQK
jgi:hypothetical protein